jgi:anti-sigma regulatory factor (Ser/Thr protein kinase)
MLTIKEASDLQKAHNGEKITQISTLEMSLAAGVELACWKLANPKAIGVSAASSRVWTAIELLGWPRSENFARFQKGNLVLQRLPTQPNDNNWTALKMEFMKTLRSNGFSNTLSSRVTGALAELTNNVWDHSERTDTGLLGFQVQNRKFTIVIADLGIGILESLRRNPLHSSIRTHSAAIEKALVPGVSRFEDISRGTGFIDFLSVVTDLHGKARLRTGNIALTIDRTQEDEIRNREYLIDFQGFQIFLYGALG